jgi:hypothetical protein
VLLLQSAARVVTAPGQLADAVRQELERPERLSPLRRNCANALFFEYGTATDRAVAVLYDLLRLPAPSVKDGRAISTCM